MTVGARLMEASSALYGGQPERALLPMAVAMDATARKRYPGQRSNRARFSRFVQDNLRFVTRAWLEAPLDDCRIRLSHPELEGTAADGTIGLDDLLYHVVRSELLREKSLTPGLLTVARVEQFELRGADGSSLCYPQRLVEACLAAAVLAPENADKHTMEPAALYICKKRYWVNRLWGRRDYFCREVLQVDLRDPAARGEPPAATILDAVRA